MRDSNGIFPTLAKGVALCALIVGMASMGAASSATVVSPRFERASEALLENGIAEIDAGRPANAVALLQRAAAANPRNGAAFTYLARAYDLAGDLPRAHKYFEIALRLEPADRLALSWGGQVDIRRGDLASAEAKLARLAEICALGCAPMDELKLALDTSGPAGSEGARLVLEPSGEGAVTR